ncbi:MAG: hypothetical protein A4E63_00229 [Syntrophorhabdus sp. PtaU1.Bin050]|nr:MAG: hypothetical protein A4E63_00229 [Syntrophorhabdus sp. PtaU1.Bin050]
MSLQFIETQIDGCNDVPLGLAVTRHGPCGIDLWFYCLSRKLEGFHNMAQHSIGQDHDRVSVGKGQVKGLPGEIAHLLNRVRRQDDGVVVAVTAPLNDLIVVGLLGTYVAEARTGPADIHYDARKFGPGKIGYAFLL